MKMKVAPKEHRAPLRRHGWIIAVAMFMVLPLTGCNISRRPPVAAVQPNYSYLRAPVAPAQPVAEVAIATRPISLGNAPTE